MEKGPENLAALRYVQDLCAHGFVYPTMGNVDAFTLSMLDDDSEGNEARFYEYCELRRRFSGSSLFTEALAELGLPLDGPGDAPAAKRALRTHLAVEAAFLRGLPGAHRNRKLHFRPRRLPTPDVSRITTADLPGLLKFDAFLENAPRFDKTVFVGHWPVVLYDGAVCCANPIFDRERHIVSLDGGCGVKHGAQLNAVLVGPDGAFSCAYCDGLPQVRALDAQARGADPFHLRWTERPSNGSRPRTASRAFAIPPAGEFSTCRRATWYDDGGRLCCADFPADRLEIAPGDLLSLVDETPLGYIVKKDGVSGLYGGRVRAL